MCELHCLRPVDSTGFPWNCGVSAMINGLMGGMAFLYGGGDFRRTMGVAIAAGFDCDNQAATLGGLIGVMHGGKAIPYDLTHKSQGSNRSAPIWHVCLVHFSWPLKVACCIPKTTTCAVGHLSPIFARSKLPLVPFERILGRSWKHDL